MDIEHDIVKGVTPAMIAWWFKNIGGDIDVDGQMLNRYLAWHPYDHVRWELARPGRSSEVGVGAQFRIVEAFGRNAEHYVDVIDTVTRLDETGISLTGYMLGCRVSLLTHDFLPAATGTRYVSRLTIGVRASWLGRAMNRALHKAFFPEAMGHAWLRHNVEEVGLLEHLLPRLLGNEPVQADDDS